jgi:hypothetical protein
MELYQLIFTINEKQLAAPCFRTMQEAENIYQFIFSNLSEMGKAGLKVERTILKTYTEEEAKQELMQGLDLVYKNKPNPIFVKDKRFE